MISVAKWFCTQWTVDFKENLQYQRILEHAIACTYCMCIFIPCPLLVLYSDLNPNSLLNTWHWFHTFWSSKKRQLQNLEDDSLEEGIIYSYKLKWQGLRSRNLFSFTQKLSYKPPIERFLIESDKTKTKAAPMANHTQDRRHSKPMRILRKYTQPALSGGKHTWPSLDWFRFCIWMVE